MKPRMDANTHEFKAVGARRPQEIHVALRNAEAWSESFAKCATRLLSADFIYHQARSARQAVIRAVAWGRRLVHGVRTIETAAGNGEPTESGPIKVWIVSATGFRQSRKRVSGLELLWRKLRPLSSAEVCVVTPENWNNDTRAMADYIARNSNGLPAIFFVGYSYGVGNYFLRFAKALQEHDLEIDTAILCDGIRRFRWLKILSFRWFRSLVWISVPENVETVYAFRQNEDGLLRGHDVHPRCECCTQVHMIELGGFDHCSIDEAQSFHRVALQEARDLIQKTIPTA